MLDLSFLSNIDDGAHLQDRITRDAQVAACVSCVDLEEVVGVVDHNLAECVAIPTRTPLHTQNSVSPHHKLEWDSKSIAPICLHSPCSDEVASHNVDHSARLGSHHPFHLFLHYRPTPFILITDFGNLQHQPLHAVRTEMGMSGVA